LGQENLFRSALPTCIHDEIILEAPFNEVKKAQEILKNSMVEAGQMYLKNVPVVVDMSVVDDWSEKN